MAEGPPVRASVQAVWRAWGVPSCAWQLGYGGGARHAERVRHGTMPTRARWGAAAASAGGVASPSRGVTPPFSAPRVAAPPPASTPTPQGTTRTHNPHTRALPHPLRRTPNHPRTDTPRPPENMRLCGLLLLLLLLAAAPSTQVAAKRSRSKRPRARTSKKALAKAAREAETTEQAAFIEALQRDASAAAVESWLRPTLQAALDSTGGDLSESACTGARLRRLGSGSGRR